MLGRFLTSVPYLNYAGVLAEEFNEMVRALEERDRRLREGKEALERAHQTNPGELPACVVLQVSHGNLPSNILAMDLRKEELEQLLPCVD